METIAVLFLWGVRHPCQMNQVIQNLSLAWSVQMATVKRCLLIDTCSESRSQHKLKFSLAGIQSIGLCLIRLLIPAVYLISIS